MMLVGVGNQGAYRWAHLVHDVLERVWAVNGEADEKDVGFRVGERPQSVVLLLSGSVPEGKLDHLARRRMGGVCDVVFEDGWDVFLQTISIPVDSVAWLFVPLGSCLSCS